MMNSQSKLYRQPINRDPMQQMAERDSLVSRSQMLAIAQEHNLLVTMSTIHRWANEPGFPMARGQRGRNLLYSRLQVIAFFEKRIRILQEDR
jgi:hypothetical protein